MNPTLPQRLGNRSPRHRTFGDDSMTAAASTAAVTGTAPTTSPSPSPPATATGTHHEDTCADRQGRRRRGGREDRLWADLVHRPDSPQEWL